MDLCQHILQITKSVVEDNEIYQKFIKRYLTWMKLNANQINEFTNQIVSNVERRLDKIIEIPLRNNSIDIFQSEWFTNLGFETEEDIKDLEDEE